jgi:hypothetical protein
MVTEIDEEFSKLRRDNIDKIGESAEYVWKNLVLTKMLTLQLEKFSRDMLEDLQNTETGEWERGKRLGIMMGLDIAYNLMTSGIDENLEELEEDED